MAVRDTLVGLTLSGDLIAVGLTGGEEQWRHLQTGTNQISIPIAHADLLLTTALGPAPPSTSALNMATGSTVWTKQMSTSLQARPGGDVLALYASDELVGVEIETGTDRWHASLGQGSIGTSVSLASVVAMACGCATTLAD